jgi:hypothetical protein
MKKASDIEYRILTERNRLIGKRSGPLNFTLQYPGGITL